MAVYVVLVNFTDQGARNIKETTRRADATRAMAKKFGVTVKDFYWTLGHHDVVDIFDAPDEASMAAFLRTGSTSGLFIRSPQ